MLKIEEGGTSTTWPGSKLVRLKKTASSTASSGTAVHEIGHAIGIEHEHKQGSGGLLVVNLSNIKKSYHDQYTADTDGDDAQTSYDLCSIMHYGAVAGKSWRKDPTKSGTVFTLTDAGKTSLAGCGAQFTSPNCRTLGQRCALSTADREGPRFTMRRCLGI